MAFGLHEFPHTDFYDSDLSELLKFNKILVDDYNEIVAEIKEARRKYEYAFKYIAHYNNHFSEQNDAMKKMFVEYVLMIQNSQSVIVQKVKDQMDRIQLFIDALDTYNKQVHASNERLVKKLDEQRLEYIQRLSDMMNNGIQDMTNTYLNLNDMIMTNFALVIETINNDHPDFDGLFESLDELMKHVDETYGSIVELMETKLEVWTGANERLVDKKLKDIEETFNKRMEEHEATVNKTMKYVAELKIDIVKDEMTWENPVTGKTENLQKILNKTWRWAKAWSLKVWEWDSLPFTVGEIEEWITNPTFFPDKKGLTVEQAEVLSRWYLIEKPDVIAQAQSVRLDLDAYADTLFIMLNERVEDWVNTLVDYSGQEANHREDFSERLDAIEKAIDRLNRREYNGKYKQYTGVRNVNNRSVETKISGQSRQIKRRKFQH